MDVCHEIQMWRQAAGRIALSWNCWIVPALVRFSRCKLTHTPTVQVAATYTRKHETLPIIHMIISMSGAKYRRDTTFKPSVVTPSPRWTELMEPYRAQPWIISMPKIFLQVHMTKSGVELCCRAFFLSTQQCHVSHSKHMCKNETATRHSDSIIKM